MAAGFEFHGLPRETLNFACVVSQQHSLYLTFISDGPEPQVAVVAPSVANAAEKAPEHLRWICLTTSPPDVSNVNQDFNFIRNNPDRLSFLLGELKEKGLEPSMIQHPTDQPDSGQWKEILRVFKKQLTKGGWIYWPEQNAKRLAKNSMFSKGALELYACGENILLGTGGSYVHIPGVASSDPVLVGACDA